MNTTNTKTYQLVKTPAINNAESGFNQVYSILEINSSGDTTETKFYYDISRISSRAEEILKALNESKLPATDVLEDIL